MALPSSGQLTLNQIHVEAGGTSGTEVRLSDSDVRELISLGSATGENKISDYYGASATPPVPTITPGVRFDTDNEYGGETGDYWERFDAPIDAYNPRQGILLWVDTYLIFDNMSTTANSGHTLTSITVDGITYSRGTEIIDRGLLGHIHNFTAAAAPSGTSDTSGNNADGTTTWPN